MCSPYGKDIPVYTARWMKTEKLKAKRGTKLFLLGIPNSLINRWNIKYFFLKKSRDQNLHKEEMLWTRCHGGEGGEEGRRDHRAVVCNLDFPVKSLGIFFFFNSSAQTTQILIPCQWVLVHYFWAITYLIPYSFYQGKFLFTTPSVN